MTGAPLSSESSESMMGTMWGWQRVMPWPMIWKERVMMLAPSTVMAMVTDIYMLPAKFFGPRQIPAPPMMSMPSMMILRPRSVTDCFMMDESTMGASWLSMMAFIRSVDATVMRPCVPMRASASWIPPNSAIGTLNCLRARQYAPTPVLSVRAAEAEPAGSETPRPSARHSTNIFQPKPQRSCRDDVGACACAHELACECACARVGR
mmetsp:Transcript_14401/g.25111  ORF Transcript_14401/g.25111 Transcript_14401/m.25111 type:complete len:207 (-) Transcript_14401:161-781(-)